MTERKTPEEILQYTNDMGYVRADAVLCAINIAYVQADKYPVKGTWAWAYEQMKEDKKVRRKIWREKQFIYINKLEDFCHQHKAWYQISSPEIGATDWELYEEVYSNGCIYCGKNTCHGCNGEDMSAVDEEEEITESKEMNLIEAVNWMVIDRENRKVIDDENHIFHLNKLNEFCLANGTLGGLIISHFKVNLKFSPVENEWVECTRDEAEAAVVDDYVEKKVQALHDGEWRNISHCCNGFLYWQKDGDVCAYQLMHNLNRKWRMRNK